MIRKTLTCLIFSVKLPLISKKINKNSCMFLRIYVTKLILYLLALNLIQNFCEKFILIAQSKHLHTKPSLGFGSNQVLFGGMIKPASAISINSCNCTGYIAKAATQSSLHLLTNSSKPLMPPTKSILSSHLKSEMPSTGDSTKSVNNCESNCLMRLLLSILSSFTFNLYH